ncbi:hypothetical protein JW758_02650 [Candidatus Peregrinibacteria bacterium]|nr:hypothetical protein [Candidatus Peregrinibacteria bacterium]
MEVHIEEDGIIQSLIESGRPFAPDVIGDNLDKPGAENIFIRHPGGIVGIKPLMMLEIMMQIRRLASSVNVADTGNSE